MMIDALESHTRLVVDAQLQPVVGTTFQPTGFANLGAAEFRRPGGPASLLVESVQSMANHLEAQGFDAATREPIALLRDLPWIGVRATDGDERLTSSRQEPHRLAAVYLREARIEGSVGVDWLVSELGLREKKPLDMPAIYRAVFALDPLALLHGVFFSDKKFAGTPKVRRAITAVVEAHDVAPAISGGLKRDDVQVKADQESGMGAKEGYGFVPFGRTEYVAREIVLSASIDLHQIRGYGLGADETQLLITLAVWELVALLDGPLRLRTACDLELTSVSVRRPARFKLPTRAELEAAIAASSVTFASPGERIAHWPAAKVA